MWQYSTLDDMEIGSQIVVNHGGKDAVVYKTGVGDYKLVSGPYVYLFSDGGINGGLDSLNQMISIEEGTKPTMTVQDSSIGVTGLDGTSKAEFDRYAGKAQRDYYTDEYMNTDEFSAYVTERTNALKAVHQATSVYDSNYTFNNDTMKKNIIIDYGVNRPNVSDTKIEKESGDFHVNYRELVDSIDISLNMLEKSKMIKSLLDDYKASNGQGVDYSNLVGDNVDNIITDASFFTNIDSVLKDEKFDQAFVVIEELDKKLGGFLDAISACSFEANQLLNIYLNKLVKSKYDSIQERSTNDISAIMVDHIMHNYLNINQINASEEELKSLAFLLEKFHPGEYSDFINSFDKRTELQKFFDVLPLSLDLSAKIVIPKLYRLLYDDDYQKAVVDATSENFIYGMNQSLEDFADGVYGLTMSYYQLDADLNKENKYNSKLKVDIMKYIIAQDFAKDEFERRTKDIDPNILNSFIGETTRKLGEKTITGGSKAILTSVGIPKVVVAILTSPFEIGKKYQELVTDNSLSSKQVSYLGAAEAMTTVSTSVMSEFLPNETFSTNLVVSVINGACNVAEEKMVDFMREPDKFFSNDIIDSNGNNEVFSSVPTDSLKWGFGYGKNKFKSSIIEKYGSYTNFFKKFILD